jgi:predicted DNA-binding protein
MDKIQLSVRVTKEEMRDLIRYANKTGRTKTDVVREFLRSLKHKKD